MTKARGMGIEKTIIANTEWSQFCCVELIACNLKNQIGHTTIIVQESDGNTEARKSNKILLVLDYMSTVQLAASLLRMKPESRMQAL